MSARQRDPLPPGARWRGHVETGRKLALSAALLAGFVWLAARGPFVAVSGGADRPAPVTAPGPPVAGGASSLETVLRLADGRTARQREVHVAPCNAATWTPADHGLCEAPCPLLVAERTAATARVLWLGAAGEPHAARLECDPDGAAGRLHLLETAEPAPPDRRADVARPVPPPPGGDEALRWSAGGWRIFADRPPDATTAVEAAALGLVAEGWRLRPTHPAAPTPEDGRVLTRGAELVILGLQSAPEGELLVSAYHPSAAPSTVRPEEVPR